MPKMLFERDEVLQWLRENNATAADASTKFGISRSTVKTWMRRERLRNPPPPPEPLQPSRIRGQGAKSTERGTVVHIPFPGSVEKVEAPTKSSRVNLVLAIERRIHHLAHNDLDKESSADAVKVIKELVTQFKLSKVVDPDGAEADDALNGEDREVYDALMGGRKSKTA